MDGWHYQKMSDIKYDSITLATAYRWINDLYEMGWLLRLRKIHDSREPGKWHYSYKRRFRTVTIMADGKFLYDRMV